MSETTQAAKKASPHPAERSTPGADSERLPDVGGLDTVAPSLSAAAVAADEAPDRGVADGLVSRQAALLGDTRFGAQRVRMLQRLQRGYGNGHVAQVINRLVADAPPTRGPIAPQQDPKFKAVSQKIGGVASKEKDHAPAKKKVAEAQAAALPPSNDVASQAGAAQVDKMAQQKPGEFDKVAFIAAVKKAIDAAAPKNLSEADEFKESGKAGQVKGEVSGMVTKGKQDSEKAIKDTTNEAPDSSAAKPKPVTPMGAENVGPAPPDVGAKQAIPDPKSAAETSMAQGPADVNQQMSQAKVTEEQLKKSNEPEFSEAVDAKKGAEAHSQQAPNDYRAAEKDTLAKSGADASATATGQLGAMHGTRAAALGALTADKGGAKSQDETKRAELATKIEGIFTTTKTDVMAILEGLDAKVNTAFETGESGARAQFEAYVERRMGAYKDKRYGDWDGAVLWAKDKLMDMPSEVDVFYTEGRDLYLKQMDGVISRVADIVGGELGRAKARIALGKQQVKEFVASQPKELQKLAKEAEQSFAGRFDELEGEVNSKQESLVQSLADKYVASRDALDSRISELKAANKGLVSQALDAVGGVIKTILQLKDMLLGVLAKAAGAIETIIADPIKFLGNLVSAIKMGLSQFVSNIGTHLKKALMGWLFGTLGEAGIQLPDSFDLKGILMLILQVIGLTYDNVRGIAVKLVGEKVVSAVEGTVKFFTTLVKEGPAGLWQWIKDKIAEINIKDMVIGAIKDFVITKIITAGVTWLISMLNPAAAFIKACKMIYDVIMFFIERGSQIMEFVNSVLDGIGAIASGSLGAAAALVENSLAKILPLAISFLASLLGVGGIAQKIKEIIEKIRAPITKLVTAVMGPILKPLKKLYDKGAKFVKGVVDKGKALGKRAMAKVKGKFYGGTDADKDKRLETAVSSGVAAVNKYRGRPIAEAILKPMLGAIRLKNRIPVLEVVPQGDKWAVHGEVARMTKLTDAERDRAELRDELEKEAREQLVQVSALLERYPRHKATFVGRFIELESRIRAKPPTVSGWADLRNQARSLRNRIGGALSPEEVANQRPADAAPTSSGPLNAAQLEARISSMPPGERVAFVRQEMERVARTRGWTRDNRVSQINNRTVYRAQDGTYYSVDTQHGRLEHCDARGTHLGEVNIDLASTSGASADHSIRIG